MSYDSEMQIHESFALLNELNLIEWFSRDVGLSTRLFINTLVGYLLNTDDAVLFRPFSESDAVIEILTNRGMNEDWFELISGNFYEAVELNAQSIGLAISDLDSMLTDEEAKQAALTYAKEWEFQVKLALKQEIDRTAGR